MLTVKLQAINRPRDPTRHAKAKVRCGRNDRVGDSFIDDFVIQRQREPHGIPNDVGIEYRVVNTADSKVEIKEHPEPISPMISSTYFVRSSRTSSGSIPFLGDRVKFS